MKAVSRNCMGTGTLWLALSGCFIHRRLGRPECGHQGLVGHLSHSEPKSLWAWLCNWIYLTELPKPGAESPQTSVSKSFIHYKVSSQPTGSGRAGWLGHAHRRLASPA